MSNSKKKYYVVFQGREPGIYDNWQDVVSNTKGFPNNVFRGYESQKEAEDAFYKFHPDIVGNMEALAYYCFMNINNL